MTSYLFGARLLELREGAGLTARELALHLKVDHTYVSHVESGRRTPHDEFLCRVADYFAEDLDILRLQAGQVPERVLAIMQRNPQLALSLIEQCAPNDAEAGTMWYTQVSELIQAHLRNGQIDALDDFDRPAFARHVDAGKNTPIYNAHSYHTKVPYQGIIPYIEHYTQPGDLVLDPFCGSGMTGVAAILSGRDAVLNDLSPAAVHIARNYVTPCDPSALEQAYEELAAELAPLQWELYATECGECGTPSLIEYSIFSDVFECGSCAAEITVWDDGRDTAGKLTGSLSCPKCQARQDKNGLRWLRSTPRVLNYTCARQCRPGRQERELTEQDLVRVARLASATPTGWVPEKPFGRDWEMWRQGHHDRGIHAVKDFFTPCNLHALAALNDAVERVRDPRVAAALKFAFTGCVNRASKRYQWNHKRPTNVLSGTLYVSSLFYEFNVFRLFERKVRAALRMFGMTRRAAGRAAVACGSATELQAIPDASVDYVFTDPPFGSNIYYSDCSLLWEAWLDDYTNRELEMVVGRSRGESASGKDLKAYRELLTAALREIRRTLKPNRWASVVFHNSSAEVWTAVRTACVDAGFTLGSAVMFDKKQRSFKGIKGLQVGELVADFDVVLNLQKTPPSLVETEEHVASEARIIESLRSYLATAPEEAVDERSTAYLHSLAVQQAWNEHLDLAAIDLRQFEERLSREFSFRRGTWHLREASGAALPMPTAAPDAQPLETTHV